MWKRTINYLENWEKKITKKFSNKQKKLWDIFLFLLVFALSSLLLHLIIWINWNPVALQRMIAHITASLLNLMGISAQWSGTYIYIKALGLIEIVKDCIGWKSFVALIGLILASRPISWKKKCLGVVLGLIFIFVLNLIRLITTVILSIHNMVSFELIHTFLWRWGLTLCILAFWFGWLHLTQKYREKKSV